MNATNSVNARPKNLLARLNRRKMVDRFTDAPCRGLWILAWGSCHSPEAIFSLLGPFSTWRLGRFFETLLSAARLSLARPVALRPRLATGLPLSWTATQYTSNAQKRSQENTLEAGWDGATGGMRPSYATTIQEHSSLATLYVAPDNRHRNSCYVVNKQRDQGDSSAVR